MSEVQGEGNVVYSDVCVCVCEIQSEGNVVYSDVCLRYRLREILFTVICL